jgi:hypothetical protein
VKHEAARGVAAQWHGGQGSALYALASTGTVQRRVLAEIARELEGTENVRAVKDLRALADYCRDLLGNDEEVMVL